VLLDSVNLEGRDVLAAHGAISQVSAASARCHSSSLVALRAPKVMPSVPNSEALLD